MPNQPSYLVAERDGDPWLFVDGKPVADLSEMRLLDFGSYITVEGGLVYEKLPAIWREQLKILGLELE